jgi:hypothetical protein
MRGSYLRSSSGGGLFGNDGEETFKASEGSSFAFGCSSFIDDCRSVIRLSKPGVSDAFLPDRDPTERCGLDLELGRLGLADWLWSDTLEESDSDGE